MPIEHTPLWLSLAQHAKRLAGHRLESLIANADARLLEAGPITADVTKNFLDKSVLQTLHAFAAARNCQTAIAKLFARQTANDIQQAALHPLLRAPEDGTMHSQAIHSTRRLMRNYSERIRSGAILSARHKVFTDVINIGIGGSQAGPEMVINALAAYNTKVTPHFIANIDPSSLAPVLERLNAETTLCIISSKTFSTQETISNAHAVKAWLIATLGEVDWPQHVLAVTAEPEKARGFGLDAANVYALPHEISGRFSVWSAIGLIIAISLGFDIFERLCAGAYAIDEHVRHSAVEDNVPLTLALIEFWYQHFWHARAVTVVPYHQQLQQFVPFLQQLVMESNGKSVDTAGQQLTVGSTPVLWGGIGTNCQHTFFQLLHQGTHFIPTDFILPLKSHTTNTVHQDWLVAHCIAQARALMTGHSNVAQDKATPGNKPSNLLFFDELTPDTLGALIAIYEHKVYLSANLMDINPFDQWGVTLGKQIANDVHHMIHHHALESLPALDVSSRQLILRYLACYNAKPSAGT